MIDVLTQLNALKRPRLLINAARLGMSDYNRDTHLVRYLGEEISSDYVTVLRQLMALEHDLDQERRDRAASYSVARHVEIMIAMMTEARELRQSSASEPKDASCK